MLYRPQKNESTLKGKQIALIGRLATLTGILIADQATDFTVSLADER